MASAELLGDALRTLRRFVHDEIAPLERRALDGDPEALASATRARIRARAVDLGLWGAELPEARGGLGLGWTGAAALGFEVSSQLLVGAEEVLAGARMPWRVLDSIAGGPAVLDEAARGQALVCWIGGPGVVAKREGNDVSFEGGADLVDAVGATHAVVCALGAAPAIGILPSGAPGVAWSAPVDLVGGAETRLDVRLEGARIPADAVVGAPARVEALAALWEETERMALAAKAAGLLHRLVAIGAEYARDRRAFGRPIADFGAVQALLADTEAEARAARALVMDTAAALDRPDTGFAARHAEVDLCKLFASEALGRGADRIVQVFGGMGYMRECPAEAIYRAARPMRILGGASEDLRAAIVRARAGAQGVP